MIGKNHDIVELTKGNVKILDDILLDLTKNINIDIMPGESDPTTGFFPQEALNKSFFQNSSVLTNLLSVTNPYRFTLNNVSILGTSGLIFYHFHPYIKLFFNRTKHWRYFKKHQHRGWINCPWMLSSLESHRPYLSWYIKVF